MASPKSKDLDVGLLIGPVGKPAKHKEPDEDQEGGPSDEDEDNLPAGALEAYQEHVEAEEAGDDAKACAALGRMVRAFMEPEEPEEEEGY